MSARDVAVVALAAAGLIMWALIVARALRGNR